MDPLHLDFHPSARPAPSWAAWLALLAAALGAALLAAHLARARDALGDLQARHDLLDARVHVAAVRVAVPGPELVRRIAADNDVIAALSVPWDDMFRALEAADSRGLGLTALVPDARERSLRLTGEARSVPDVLAYVERLSAARGLQHVRLQGYETVNREGVDVVDFTVVAAWQAR